MVRCGQHEIGGAALGATPLESPLSDHRPARIGGQSGAGEPERVHPHDADGLAPAPPGGAVRDAEISEDRDEAGVTFEPQAAEILSHLRDLDLRPRAEDRGALREKTRECLVASVTTTRSRACPWSARRRTNFGSSSRAGAVPGASVSPRSSGSMCNSRNVPSNRARPSVK